jgi:hypothetical protein
MPNKTACLLGVSGCTSLPDTHYACTVPPRPARPATHLMSIIPLTPNLVLQMLSSMSTTSCSSQWWGAERRAGRYAQVALKQHSAQAVLLTRPDPTKHSTVQHTRAISPCPTCTATMRLMSLPVE